MSEQYPHLDSVMDTLLMAANKGLIFPISREEAHDLRQNTRAMRGNNDIRRRYVAGLAKDIGEEVDVTFEFSEELDLGLVSDFMKFIISLDEGAVDVSRKYTSGEAAAFLAYRRELRQEEDFLLGLERMAREV